MPAKDYFQYLIDNIIIKFVFGKKMQEWFCETDVT